MSSEKNENNLIISDTGGMIRKMDHQLELMNRVLGEIAERKTEIIPSDPSFIGIRAGEERDWEIAPGVKMTFCWCPPGEFIKYDLDTSYFQKDASDLVNYTHTKGFWMAKTQITQKQWVAIMGNNPSKFEGQNLPVETVSWHDTQAFLERLNAKIGNTDGGQMILPTVAQWEYACLAGHKGPCTGATHDVGMCYREKSTDITHPVGLEKPNPWGIHDMLGTLNEWSADYLCEPNSEYFYVWLFVTQTCQKTGHRLPLLCNLYPTRTHSTIGFRIARMCID